MRLYLIAMQFLSIIPLPFDTRCQKEDLGRSLALFPLAGVTIGALLLAINWLISGLLPRSLLDALLIAVLSVVTGALHLDGLADVCDGLAARGSQERFLAVMKDSQIGAAGAAGVALGVLLKWQALVAVPDILKWQAVLLFLMLSRFSQVQSVVFSKKARNDGLGSAFIGGAGKIQLFLAGGMSLVISWFLCGYRGAIIFAVTVLLTLVLKIWSHRRLGGITGDVVGCISELNEISVLILVSALFHV